MSALGNTYTKGKGFLLFPLEEYTFLNGGMYYVRCDCNGYGWYFIGSK